MQTIRVARSMVFVGLASMIVPCTNPAMRARSIASASLALMWVDDNIRCSGRLPARTTSLRGS